MKRRTFLVFLGGAAALSPVATRAQGSGVRTIGWLGYRSAKAKDQASGMGLGLAVSKRALEVQNGSIGAEVRDGGGSEFYFSLPPA